MKKILLGITLGLLLIAGGCSDDAGIQDELTEVLGVNTLLATETEELQSTNASLLESSEELEESYKELNEKYEELTAKLAPLDNYEQKTNELKEEHKENIEAFEKDITKLKGENKEFSDKIAAAEQKEKEVAAAKQKEAEVATANKQQSKNGGGTSTPKTVSKTTEVKQDCNIKGSSGGIYHTPGSTYYGRTTSPVAMFCTVEEAQNAGYRAPKR